MFKGFMVQARTGEGPAINSSTAASSGQRLVGRFLEGEGHKTLHCSSPDVRQIHNNNNNNNNNNNTSSNTIQCSFKWMCVSQDTATHKDSEDKHNIEVIWVAPDPVPDEFSFL